MTTEEPATATSNLRAQDVQNYSGGGEIRNHNNPDNPIDYAGCTAGWPAHDSTGHHYLMVAAHCAWPDGTGANFKTGAAVPIGDVAGYSTSVDALAIRSDAGYQPGLSDGTMIIGDWFGGDFNDVLPIAGAATPSIGETLCQSGAYSGTICAMVVKEQNQTKTVCEPGGHCETFEHQNRVEMHPDAGGPAVGQGDSGGPVYDPLGPNYNPLAVGIISASDGDPVECQGDQTEGRTCTRGMWYTDIFSALDEYGYTLTTYRE